MWKHIKRPEELIGYDISDSGKLRDSITKVPISTHIDSAGYVVVYKYKDRLHKKEFKVHRIVADHFVAPVTDELEVHHKDRNRGNPEATNLIVCTHAEHRRLHATTIKPVKCIPSTPGKQVLTETQVHEICKMLEADCSYPYIRQELKLYNITDDCINKINIGKNWTNISSQYNLTKQSRQCMNMYSNNALVIGILMNRGYTAKEIGRMMGFDTSSNTSYQRLFKAATRYKDWYRNGRWGLITKSEANNLISKYIDQI